MVREVITLNVGQAGVQLGQCLWRQYNYEHNIDNSGKLNIPNTKDNNDKNSQNSSPKDKTFEVFYELSNKGYYVPRTIFVDLEPNTIDDVKSSDISSIYHPQTLLPGIEDAANNFARGHYTIGKEMIDKLCESLRKQVEKCHILEGFFINHSIGGGTGSGFGALILERLAVDYRKKYKFSNDIFPSETLSTAIVEPYNACFGVHWLLDHAQFSVPFDNEKLYQICQNNLDIKRPDYKNINNLLTKYISGITCGLRFAGEQNNDLQKLEINLISFPRLHFFISCYAPILSKNKKDTHSINNITALTDICFAETSNWLIGLPYFDKEYDKYMGISLNYRGQIGWRDAMDNIKKMRSGKDIKMVDWISGGIKLGLCDVPIYVNDKYDDISAFKYNVSILANNTGIRRKFSRLMNKFSLMYSQRAYVHWYVGEGMEEGEFSEVQEDFEFLRRDYQDVEGTIWEHELNEEINNDGSDNDYY